MCTAQHPGDLNAVSTETQAHVELPLTEQLRLRERKRCRRTGSAVHPNKALRTTFSKLSEGRSPLPGGKGGESGREDLTAQGHGRVAETMQGISETFPPAHPS